MTQNEMRVWDATAIGLFNEAMGYGTNEDEMINHFLEATVKLQALVSVIRMNEKNSFDMSDAIEGTNTKFLNYFMGENSETGYWELTKSTCNTETLEGTKEVIGSISCEAVKHTIESNRQMAESKKMMEYFKNRKAQ